MYFEDLFHIKRYSLIKNKQKHIYRFISLHEETEKLFFLKYYKNITHQIKADETFNVIQ